MKNSINKRNNKEKAQSALEYAMVIACLAGALLAMQIYVKRSIQGRTRDAADEIGEQYSAKTTTSSLTQIITNPTDVTTTGRPRFIEITNPKTGLKERREIIEIERKEPITIYTATDRENYEKTGKLSDEKLFD